MPAGFPSRFLALPTTSIMAVRAVAVVITTAETESEIDDRCPDINRGPIDHRGRVNDYWSRMVTIAIVIHRCGITPG
jgi:hypothetical protein